MTSELWTASELTEATGGELSAPFVASGIIGGHGDVKRTANGALDGNASIASDTGSVAYADNASQPLVVYHGLALNANLSPQSTHATVHAALDHDGKLDGEVTLSGAPGSAQALSGRVDVVVASLGFVELLTPELANTRGRLAASYTLAGSSHDTPAKLPDSGAVSFHGADYEVVHCRDAWSGTTVLESRDRLGYAMFREMVKDVRKTLNETYFGKAEHSAEVDRINHSAGWRRNFHRHLYFTNIP